MLKRTFGKLLCATLLAAFACAPLYSVGLTTDLLAINFGPGPGGNGEEDSDEKDRQQVEENLGVTGTETEETAPKAFEENESEL